MFKNSQSWIRCSIALAALCFGAISLNAETVNVPATGLTVEGNSADSFVTDNTDLTNPSVLSFQKNGDLAFTGHITGNIALNINTNGYYFQPTSGANDFTGGTTITSGKLSLKLGTEVGSGTITMSPGTHLMNNGDLSNPVINNNIELLSGGKITIRAGWNGSNKTGRASITVNGVISGDGGVNFGYEPTPGIMTINGANTYTGGTVVSTDNLRTDNPVPLKALYLVLGSDTPFGTGPVTVSGKWDEASNNSTDLKTYFALDNTTTDRNVTTGDLTIEAGRTLKLVQKSVTSGKTAELTVRKFLGSGTVSNRIDDVATYGNPLTKVNINLETASRTQYPVILDGDFDLHINYPCVTDNEFIFSGSKDVTSTYTGDIYIHSGIVGSRTGVNMGSGTIHLYNGAHLMNYAECIPVYKNNIVLEGNAAEGYSIIRSGWGSTAHQPEGIVLDGVISGAGKLAYTAEATPGLTTLNGSNTYTGGTLIAFNMRSDNRYQGGLFQIGSDSPFGTGNVQLGMSGAYPITYFILDNTTTARNVTIPGLTISGDSPDQKLVLTQRDVSEGAKAANITIKGFSTGKPLTLSNVVTDATTYGNPIKAVTISRTTQTRAGYNIKLNGDFDLYINEESGRDKEFGIQNTYDARTSYTGNIYIQKGFFGTSNGLNLGSGKIFMSSGTTLMNFNAYANIQITNDIEVTGNVNIRGGWGGSYYAQSFLRLSGDISGTGKVDFGSEPTPVITVISGNNTYTGGTIISNYGVGGNNRYPYNYLVLQSDSPFGTGVFTVDNASVRMEFDALTSDRQLKNDVTINSGKTLNVTSVGPNTSYLNGTYTANGTLQLINPTSTTVVTNVEQHLQALAVPADNISRFSLSPKDENSQAGKIVGNLKLEGGSSIQVSGTYNGQELPTITGTLTMDPGSELILDASNVADPDQFLMNIGDISMAEGSFITLIPNTSEDFNKLISFGEGVDLSRLQFGDAGGYVFQVMGNELWALGGGAIPEPSTWALMLLGLLGLAFRRKK